MINILVTGIGGGGVGEQIIKALKASALTFKLFGTDVTHISKGITEVDSFHKVNPASSIQYLPDLLQICKEQNIQVLFPGSEPELKVISKNRAFFEDFGVFIPINPEEVISTCLDKSKCALFLNENSFDSPKSITIRREEDLYQVDFLPAVLKPSIGGGGSANILLAQKKEDVLVFGKYLLEIYDEFVIQQYVGNEDSEFTVGVLLDMDGDVINSIAIKRIIDQGLGSKIKLKNKTGNASFGSYLVISSGISQGKVMPRSVLNEICEDIASKLGATSSINIQCRFIDGKAYVFEINPRYSGTTPLRALVGYNEPEILINQKFHNISPQKYFKYKTGYLLRGLQEVYIGE